MQDKRRLVVISVDALVTEDLTLAATLPGFSRVMAAGSHVSRVMSVFPTLTYPIHVVQMTGRNMMHTGVANNEQFQPGSMTPDWIWDIRHVRVPTIFDAARAAGLSTCAIMWPVTAGADIDFCVPEVWDMDDWNDPVTIYRRWSSPRGFEYFLKHVSALGWHPKPAMDEFAVLVAEDIFRHEMPDVSFVHVSAVDIARHFHGLFSREVDDAVRRVDGWIVRLLNAIADGGNLDSTNVIICSDHGHLMIDRQVNLNVVLRERGFIRDAEGGGVRYSAYAHSSGLSAQVMLEDPSDSGERARLLALLEELRRDPAWGIRRILTREEAEREFALSGRFEYVIEGEAGVAFGHCWTGRPIRRPGDGDYSYVIASHGHHPALGPQPVLLAAGPGIRTGVMLESRSILDETPTFAALLGLRMEGLEGSPIAEILKEDYR